MFSPRASVRDCSAAARFCWTAYERRTLVSLSCSSGYLSYRSGLVA